MCVSAVTNICVIIMCVNIGVYFVHVNRQKMVCFDLG